MPCQVTSSLSRGSSRAADSEVSRPLAALPTSRRRRGTTSCLLDLRLWLPESSSWRIHRAYKPRTLGMLDDCGGYGSHIPHGALVVDIFKYTSVRYWYLFGKQAPGIFASSGTHSCILWWFRGDHWSLLRNVAFVGLLT